MLDGQNSIANTCHTAATIGSAMHHISGIPAIDDYVRARQEKFKSCSIVTVSRQDRDRIVLESDEHRFGIGAEKSKILRF